MNVIDRFGPGFARQMQWLNELLAELEAAEQRAWEQKSKYSRLRAVAIRKLCTIDPKTATVTCTLCGGEWHGLVDDPKHTDKCVLGEEQ